MELAVLLSMVLDIVLPALELACLYSGKGFWDGGGGGGGGGGVRLSVTTMLL